MPRAQPLRVADGTPDSAPDCRYDQINQSDTRFWWLPPKLSATGSDSFGSTWRTVEELPERGHARPSVARVLRASRISGDPQSELAPTVADPRADGYRATPSNKSALAS